MAPSNKKVIDAVKSVVLHMFHGSERDQLTVNNVRSQVETKLGLDSGFLKEGSWKQRSKEIVKTESERLIQLEEAGEQLPSSQSTPEKPVAPPAKKSGPVPVKKSAKRVSGGGDKVQPRKRQKKQETLVSEDEESILSSVEDTPEESEDSYVSDEPKPKVKAVTKDASKPQPSPQQKKQTGSDAKASKSENKKLRNIDTKILKPSALQKPGSMKEIGNSSSELSDLESQASKDSRKDEKDQLGQSESEMSVVLDEPPKRKKKSNTATKTQSSGTKSSKPHKISKITAELSPDESEIKTLQSQLTKCGIRKIWGVVLKPYGTDTKAKIRHLKGILKDVGMEGRFSEARAKEIRESRELMADLEAVKEGEAKWGMARESRSKAVSVKKTAVTESDEEEDDDEDLPRSGKTNEKEPTRAIRAKMDLAFLGSESDSD